MKLWLLVLILFDFASSSNSDLPLFPSVEHVSSLLTSLPTICGSVIKFPTSQLIPQNLWIAVKNKSDINSYENIQDEIKINPTWSVHICDNDEKDQFMNTFYANTSLLWAYNNINSKVAGAAKADIWRYAILLVIGGVYIDSDSQLTKPLDQVLLPDDRMVVTFELNHFDGDWCYSPHSEFSTFSTLRHFPHASQMNLFRNRNLLNWCIMSAPSHPFLRAALTSFVTLVKLEHIGVSALKIGKWDAFSKYVYCTTGPSLLTAAARKVLILEADPSSSVPSVVHPSSSHPLHPHHPHHRHHHPQHLPTFSSLSNQTPPPLDTVPSPPSPSLLSDWFVCTNSSHRLASRDFLKEGGVFKAVLKTNHDQDHYTQIKHASDAPFLLSYASPEVTRETISSLLRLEGSEGGLDQTLVKGRSERSIYLILKGQRREIGSMDVLAAWGFTLDQVIHSSDFVVDNIPKGEPLPEQPPTPPTPTPPSPPNEAK